MSDYHTSVLLKETVDGLAVKTNGIYVDCTAGGGGHSAEILRRGGCVYAIDCDTDALKETEKTLSAIKKDGWTVVKGNFKDIERLMNEIGIRNVDGVLFDLGVSSHQLDDKDRGFSYRFESGPLDLRLNKTGEITGKEIILTYSEEALYEVFSKLGEEKYSRAIAHAISRARAVKEIETAGDLVETVRAVVGERDLSATLSRVFQALRIEVNGELDALKSGLAGAERLLSPHGRLVVISFHSLEDRIVKLWMRRKEWDIITKKPVTAGEEEVYCNRRSRSAKLRVAQRNAYE
jgi:16S rRNA (cytosine1402-N4)-methyltransferase